jgi:hypothetical protein
MKMPNARDAHSIAQHRILCLGDTGSGKTSQILTLPGKKFAYLFDSNALLSLRGYDVDYEEVLPEVVSAAVSSLSAKVVSDKRSTVKSDVFQKFEQEFDDRLKTGFFDPYNWICLDSSTTLLDLIMDRILSINGRFGQWPQQDDYGPQMIAFQNICRTITSMGKGIYMTGHLEVKQDKTSKVVSNRPMMTGRLVAKIPLLFSDVFYCDASLDDKGKVNYRIQTVPDLMNRNIRTSIKGLEPFEDVTIDFAHDPVGQGLGGILQWEAKQLQK